MNKYGLRLKRITAFLLSFVMIMALCINTTTQTAYAKTRSYYILNMAIDPSTWLLDGTVAEESHGDYINRTPVEGQRYSESVLKDLKNAGETMSPGTPPTSRTGANATWSTQISTKDMALTFPGDTSHGGGGTEDEFAARAIKDKLLYDFNDALEWYYKEHETDADVQLLLKNNDNTITKEKLEAFTRVVNNVLNLAIAGTGSVDATAVELDKASKNHTDLTHIGDRNLAYRTLRYASNPGDGYVSWQTLAYEAIGNTYIMLDGDELGTSIDSVDTAGKPAAIIGHLVNALGYIVNAIRGALGMWNLDQLIFNDGIRGGNSYCKGVFPRSWETVVWGLFVISEIIALIMLFFGVIQNIVRYASTSMNHIGRMRMWEQVSDLLKTALMLALLPLLVQVLLELSFSLTGIISSGLTSGGKSLSIAKARSNFSATASVGAAVVQFLYLGIDIYFNFFYVMRSLMVALLIILAPICLILSTFSPKYQDVREKWFREIIANIFIQPIHALIFLIILLIPANTHRFDTIIMAYAVIPLTNGIRSLLMGDAGGLAGMVAGQGKVGTMRTMGGAASAGIGAVGGAISGLRGKKGAGDESKGGSDNANGGGSDGSNGFNGGTGTDNITPKNQFDPDGQSGNNNGAPAQESAQSGNTTDNAADTSGGSRAASVFGTGGSTSGAAAGAASASAASRVSGFAHNFKDKALDLKQSANEKIGAAKDRLESTAGGRFVSGALQTGWGAAKTAAGIGAAVGLGALEGGAGIRVGNKLKGGVTQLAASGGADIRNGLRKPFEHRDAEPNVQNDGNANPTTSTPAGQTPTADDSNTAAVNTTKTMEDAFADPNNESTQLDPVLEQYAEKSDDGARVSYTMDEQGMADAGISKVRYNKDDGEKGSVSFRASGAAARAYDGYNRTLQSLSPDGRAQLEAATGVKVTPITRNGQATGNYDIKIDKEQFRQATGTQIQTSKDAPGFTVSSANSQMNMPSLTPRATATRTSVSSSGEVTKQKASVSYQQAASMIKNGVVNNEPLREVSKPLYERHEDEFTDSNLSSYQSFGEPPEIRETVGHHQEVELSNHQQVTTHEVMPSGEVSTPVTEEPAVQPEITETVDASAPIVETPTTTEPVEVQTEQEPASEPVREEPIVIEEPVQPQDGTAAEPEGTIVEIPGANADTSKQAAKLFDADAAKREAEAAKRRESWEDDPTLFDDIGM